MTNSLDFSALNEEYAEKRPKDLIRYALEQHDSIAVSFSGAEDAFAILSTLGTQGRSYHDALLCRISFMHLKLS